MIKVAGRLRVPKCSSTSVPPPERKRPAEAGRFEVFRAVYLIV